MIRKQKLQVGELVVIKDYSYAGRVGLNGKITHSGVYEPHCKQQFKVVVVDCQIPTYMFMGEWRVADTIVIGQEDNSMWFVYSGLVEQVLPKHEITIDGQTIELSHKSFLNLKRQLT